MQVRIGNGEWIDSQDVPISVEFSNTDRRSLTDLSEKNNLMVNYNPRLYATKDVISWARSNEPIQRGGSDESTSR